MMMIKAGSAVDSMIDSLIPLLDEGDIIIDGGNSTSPIPQDAPLMSRARVCSISARVFPAARRCSQGSEHDARRLARRMAEREAIFQAICAKVEDGTPCCDWVGENGAGHFVKMVHNGIEYGDMQLICEAYQLMRDLLGMSADEMHEVFAKWNTEELDSYLIEITSDILAYKDTDGKPHSPTRYSTPRGRRAQANGRASQPWTRASPSPLSPRRYSQGA